MHFLSYLIQNFIYCLYTVYETPGEYTPWCKVLRDYAGTDIDSF